MRHDPAGGSFTALGKRRLHIIAAWISGAFRFKLRPEVKEMDEGHLNELARYRFGIIAPVIQGTYEDESISAYCRRITKKPMKLPDGREFLYKAKTVEKWISSYKSGGIDAITPKHRSDLGRTRVISREAEQEIFRLKEKYPRLNATQIHDRLVEEGVLPATVSLSSVQRYIKRNGLKGAAPAAVRERKAFEEAYFGGMWQADTCYLPYLREDDKNRRVYLLMILDDCTRMIVGGKLFYQDNAYNFQQVLREAVETYGIPNKLYVDNGAPYRNDQLSQVCASVGIVLLHTPIRDGASKGKVERNFRTLKERWLYGMDFKQFQSLAEADRSLRDYIRKHNTTRHGATGCTPLSRYLETNNRIRKPKSEEWLKECFCNRVGRQVGKDATLRIDGVSYDVPLQFMGQKVEIRYLPDRMEEAYIQCEGKRYPLAKTNKVENARTKRLPALSIDYEKAGVSGVH
jgi:transposase InsO family protein